MRVGEDANTGGQGHNFGQFDIIQNFAWQATQKWLTASNLIWWVVLLQKLNCKMEAEDEALEVACKASVSTFLSNSVVFSLHSLSQLVLGAVCSPSNDMCCTKNCQFESADVVCSNSTALGNCRGVAYCSGNNASCAEPEPLPEGTAYNTFCFCEMITRCIFKTQKHAPVHLHICLSISQ